MPVVGFYDMGSIYLASVYAVDVWRVRAFSNCSNGMKGVERRRIQLLNDLRNRRH